MVNKKVYRLTQSGYQELQDELQKLINDRPKIAEAIKVARDFGDLSENEEYSSRKEDQQRNEARITEIEAILATAEIIKEFKTSDRVVLGSKVVLKNDQLTKEFQLVGTVEADPAEGKISDESPIGQELIGKKKGDTIVIKTPKDTVSFKITDIS
jgi:transcription elongation factor GreA